MPYVDPEHRALYTDEIKHFEEFHASLITPGELNYLITSLLHSVVKKQGRKYKLLNGLMGVLSCVTAEFYRMVVAPYENQKRLENGGVSELDAINMEDTR